LSKVSPESAAKRGREFSSLLTRIERLRAAKDLAAPLGAQQVIASSILTEATEQVSVTVSYLPEPDRCPPLPNGCESVT